MNTQEMLNKLLKYFSSDIVNVNETKSSITFSKEIFSQDEATSICHDVYNFINNTNIFYFIFTNNDEEHLSINKSSNIEDLLEDIEDLFYVNSKIIAEFKIDINLLEDKFNIENPLCNYKFFYSKDFLCDYIKKCDFKRLENELFNSNLKTQVLFIKDNVNISNEYIEFKNIDSLDLDTRDKINKNDIVEKKNLNCKYLNSPVYLTPYYLLFNSSDELACVLNEKMCQLSFQYILSETYSDNSSFYSNVNDSSNIIIRYNHIDEINYEDAKNVYDLFNWIYTGVNIEEKFIIIRKTISHVIEFSNSSNNFQLLILSAKKILNLSQLNFKIYLEGNIEEFFNQKDTIYKNVCKVSMDLYNQILTFTDTLNKTFVSTIGVIIVAILGYIQKSELYVLKFTLLVYFLYILMVAILTLINTEVRVKSIIKSYNEFIDGLDFITNDTSKIDDAINNYKKQRSVYIVLNFILCILSLICLYKTNSVINIFKYIFG